MAYGYRYNRYRRRYGGGYRSILRSAASGYRIGGINIGARNRMLAARRPLALRRRVRLPKALIGRVRAYSAMNTGNEVKWQDFTDNTNAIPVNGFIHTPKPEFNFTVSPSPAQATFASVSLGTTRNSRIGRRINIKAIRCRYQLVMANPLTGSASQHRYYADDWVRFILLVDKQSNGAAPGIKDILTLDPVALANDVSICSKYNMDTTDRFIICKDFTVHMQLGTSLVTPIINSDGSDSETYNTTVALKHIKFKYTFPGRGLPISYQGSDGVLADIVSNNIVLLSISSQGLTNVSYGNARIYYNDL